MTEEIRKDLPAFTATNFPQRMRESMMTYLGKQGDPLDRGLTLRDLTASGLVRLANGYNLSHVGSGSLPLVAGPQATTERDLTPPPTPTGFKVDSGITYIFFEHDAPVFRQGHGYQRTNVYGATRVTGAPAPVFANAVLITRFEGQFNAYPTNPSTTWHLWIKWETIDGVESIAPAGGTNGLVTTTGADVALLISALTNKITSSELDIALRGRVNLIDGTGVGSVSARVAIEADARAVAVAQATSAGAAAVADEATARTQSVIAEAAARTLAVSTEAQSRIDAVSAEASVRAQQILTEQNTRAQGLLDEATARGTDITTVNTLRQQGDAQVASTVTTLTATVNNDRANAASAIQSEATTRADAVSAEAVQRVTLAARVGLTEGGISTNTAAITSEASTRASAVDAVSSQVTTLTASSRTRPNLCPDVDTWTSGSGGGSVAQDSWGKHRISYGLPAGTYVWGSPLMPAQPGADYVIAGDSLMLFNAGQSGDTVYLDLLFYDGAGAVVFDGPQNPIASAHDYSSNGDIRKLHSVQATAPMTAATMQARFVLQGPVGTYSVGFRQVKVERGTLPATAYSSELEIVNATAAIKTEAQARIDAVSAEAQQRSTLAAQMRGGYGGTDLGSVTTGLIYEERTARATQTAALSQQITLLNAGSGEQFDYKKIFYFDTDAEGWTGAGGAITASGGFLNCPLGQASSNITSPYGLGVDAVKYSQVRLRIRKTGTNSWAGKFWWTRTGDTGFLSARSIAIPEPTYDANGIGLITVNPPWDGVIEQINLDFTGNQTSANNFTVDFVAIGRPSPGASSAELLDERTARASADLAETTSRQVLSSKLTGAADPTAQTLGSLSSGLIFEERQARSTQDSALSTSISNLTATVGSNANVANAAVQNEATARADADSAEASQRSTLQASLSTRPNLCPDVDAWPPQPPFALSFDAWGKTLRAVSPVAGSYVVGSPIMPCYASQAYTITGDSLLSADSGGVYFDLIFLDAGGAIVLDGPQNVISTFHDHSNTNSNRNAHAVSCVAPAGAVQMYARFVAVAFDPGTRTFSAFGCRQIKVEQGGLPATLYTQEAAVQSLNAAIKSESVARTTADTAFAQQTDAIVARANTDRSDTNAALLTEQTARANADTASSSRIDTLTASVSSNQTAALAAVSSEASTRATQTSANASRTDVLFSKLGASPNLCPDVDKWSLGTGFSIITDGWGKSGRLGSMANGTYVCISPAISCYAGTVYTLTGDSLRFMTGGGVAFDMFFLDAAGNSLGYVASPRSYTYHDHINDDSNRNFHAIQETSPANTVAVKVRFYVENGVGIQAAGFRQVKLEQRSLPATFYTQEGEISSVNAAVVTERVARVSAGEAFTQLTNGIVATANTDRSANLAAVNTEQTARINADGALSSRVDSVVASAATDRSNTNAAVLAEQNARAGADQSLATQISQLVATTNTDRAYTNAVITDERSVRAAADSGLTSQVNTLTSTANSDRFNTNAAIVLEQDTRANANNALTAQINTLVATANTDRGNTQSLVQQANQARADGDGANSGQITTVQARLFTRPNLCADVDLWTLATGFAVNSGTPWGRFVASFSQTDGATLVCQSPRMNCYPGTAYTITGDSVRFCSTGAVYFDLIFLDSAGNIVLDGPQIFDTSYHDFSSSNFNRDFSAVSVVSPANAVQMLARFVAANVTGVQAVGFRHVKVEQGGLPATAFTQETALENTSAAVRVESQARSLQTGELYAQYTIKTDVAGLVSGYGLASTGGNSAPSSLFGVRATSFYVAPPSVAQATAPTDSLYDGYVWLDTSVTPNVTRYRSGNQWVLSSPRLPFIIQTTPITVDGLVVPPGVYIDTAFIRDATITRAKIGNAAIDDAKIANLSASKIIAGSIAVGQFIQSGNYIANTQGWVIHGNGTAEFSGVVVRGTIYALAGQIGGINIQGDAVTSVNYSSVSGSGFRLGADGTLNLPDGSVTARKVNVMQLSAITADVGLLRTRTTGERVEVEANQIRVYDAANVLRVLIGQL